MNALRERLPRFRLRTIITALVLSALVPASVAWIGARRESEVCVECQNNLRIIALGLINHENANGTFPPGTVIRPDLPVTKRLSWYASITIYLHSGFLINLNEGWDEGSNRVPMILFTNKDESPDRVVPLGNHWLFQCPAHQPRANPNGPCETDYVGIAGLGTDAPTLPTGHPRAGVFGYERQTRHDEIKDGLSTTMMLAETSSANGPWTAGGPSTVRGLDPNHPPYIGHGKQFGGPHRGGASVAFADGSVRFLRDTIDPRVFEALSTIAGREPLPAGWER